MKCIHEKYHPNGFKIVLASMLGNTTLETFVSPKAVRKGAQLQIVNSHQIQMNLDPNSAVLKVIGNQFSPLDLQWLDWEIVLQESLVPYLCCLYSGKDDKSLTESLQSKLHILNSFVPKQAHYFSGKPSPTDIVLLGALIPLFSSPKGIKMLESQKELYQYLNFLRSQPKFKDAEARFFGSEGVSLGPWVANQSAVPSSKLSVTKLLKGQDTAAKPSPPSGSPTTEERSLTAKEVKDAELAWLGEVEKLVSSKKKVSPVLPVKGERNTMVTSALPYVNNVPHLGNIIGCVLSADCFARFCRLRGDNIIYICGTDEYGTATETKALAEGSTPQQICDKYHALHSQVYQWFNIAFDFFGRTTTKSQTTAAQSIFWQLNDNKKITQNTVEQLYCSKCNRFLADRFVEGTCPHPGCGFDDARGDQCDACGKLVNATELVKPRCKLCSQTPSLKGSTHLFLDLPQIEADLATWMNGVSGQWTANAKVICESWLRDGLKERCITRDLKWGTPVPLEGFTDKVFYVWYDAPIGYISMTMEYSDQWELWWKDPDNVSYYQFMAKDNVPFHGVIFPSCQIASKDTWTKVSHLIATEYLNYEDGKFSKSRNVGVFGDQARETGIASDVWRFYLLFVRPESHDTSFSWVDLQTKNNSELLNNLGNFINRSLKFVYQFYGGVVPECSPNESDFRVMAGVNQELEKYSKSLGACRLRDGIRSILSITRIGNQFVQENEPYKLIKADRSEQDKKRGATVIAVSVNIVALVAVLLEPFMPDTSKKILDVLNIPSSSLVLPTVITQFIKSGHQIKEPSPLIRKITDDEIEILRKQFAGVQPSVKVEPKKASGNEASQVKENVIKDPAEVQRLENLVTEQGAKVRDLKGQGATKDVLGAEIEKLLQLKETLAVAQGIDPASVRGGNKKGKKKK